MAPNFPLARPMEEALNPIRFPAEHLAKGTHKVSSTYSKKVLFDSGVSAGSEKTIPDDAEKSYFIHDFITNRAKDISVIEANAPLKEEKYDETTDEIIHSSESTDESPIIPSDLSSKSPLEVYNETLVNEEFSSDDPIKPTPLPSPPISESMGPIKNNPHAEVPLEEQREGEDDKAYEEGDYEPVDDKLITLEGLFIEEVSRDGSNALRIVLREEPSLSAPKNPSDGFLVAQSSLPLSRDADFRSIGLSSSFPQDPSVSKEIRSHWLNHRDFPRPTEASMVPLPVELRATKVGSTPTPDAMDPSKRSSPPRQGRKLNSGRLSATTGKTAPSTSFQQGRKLDSSRLSATTRKTAPSTSVQQGRKLNSGRLSVTTRKTAPSTAAVQQETTTVSSIHKAEFSDLHHHEKSLEELSRNVKEVSVTDDPKYASSEATTVIILGGMCAIIMMLICFLYLVTKWKKRRRKDKLEEFENPPEKEVETEKIRRISTSLAPTVSFLSTHPNSKSSITLSSFLNLEELGKEEELGHLWFSLKYDKEKSDLHLNILHARYPNGRGISNNPGEVWVEVRIITPMNKIRCTNKTTTRKATQAPVFNHSFNFLLEEDGLKECILKLILYDSHPKRGGQQTDTAAGSVILPFSSVDIYNHKIYSRDLL